MFERYTEQARRVIFFACYEASMYGSSEIGSEHLLLGLLNDRAGPTPAALREAGTLESIRADVEEKFFAKLPKANSLGELTDLRSIRAEAWLATVTWTPSKRTKAKKQPGTLRLVAVLNRKQDGWRVVWAHLMELGRPQ